MREVELKSIVPDMSATRRTVESAGAHLTFEGKLFAQRYGDPAGALLAADHVLRLRIYENDGKREGFIDWKGPTRSEDGYKVREGSRPGCGDPDTTAIILSNLGYTVIRSTTAKSQYELDDAVIRFEKYPQMDDLVEVEGSPEAIERAILILNLPAKAFTRTTSDFTADSKPDRQQAAVNAEEYRNIPNPVLPTKYPDRFTRQ